MIIKLPDAEFDQESVGIAYLFILFLQAILPIEQSIPRSTYIHPPAVNAAKGAF